MDMDMGSGNSTAHACKISMLWNWSTVDACFISTQWHVRSLGGFAGTVIGVFLIMIALEAFRRLGREYDRSIKRAYYATQTRLVNTINKDDAQSIAPPFRPTFAQHLIRSVCYAVQFAVGYLMMLMAMYYNGYIIFAIFLGAFAGYLISSRDTACEFEAPGVRGECCA